MTTSHIKSWLRFSLRKLFLFVLVAGVGVGIWGRYFGEDLTTDGQQRNIGVTAGRPRGYHAEVVFRKGPFSGRRQLEFLLIYPKGTGISIEGGSSTFSPDTDGVDVFGRKLFLDGRRVIIDPRRPILVLSDQRRRCLAFALSDGMDVGNLDPNMLELTTSSVWRDHIQPAIEAEELP